MRSLCLALWSFLALASGTAGAVTYDVMLDASKSMRGYVGEHARDRGPYTDRWRLLLGAMEKGARNKYQFGDADKFRRVGSSLVDVALDHNNTLLADAVRDWLHESGPKDALVIITDNQAAGGDSSQSAVQQRQLEGLLTAADSPFGYIGVYAVRLSFHGTVYSPDNSVKNRYRGDRALVTYVLGRTGLTVEDHRQLVKLVRDAWSAAIGDKALSESLRYFPIRPFDSDSTSSALSRIDIDPSADANVTARLVDDQLEISNYAFGNELSLGFNVNIGTGENSLLLKDIALSADLAFEGYPELMHSRDGKALVHATVNPSRATFMPNEIRDFKIGFRIMDFGFNELPFLRRLEWTMKNEEQMSGMLKIKFQAAKENVQVAPSVMESWGFTGSPDTLGNNNPDIQGRVYHLDNLIANLVPVDIPVQTLTQVPVTLKMRFPPWPLLWIILLILVIVAAVVGLFVWMGRGVRFMITDDLGHETEFGVGLLQSYTYFGEDDKPLFRLRWLGLASLVTSPYRLRSARMIGAGDRVVIADPETQDEREFQLLKPDNIEPGGEPGYE